MLCAWAESAEPKLTTATDAWILSSVEVVEMVFAGTPRSAATALVLTVGALREAVELAFSMRVIANTAVASFRL